MVRFLLKSGETYRNYAVSGTSMGNGQIPSQYTTTAKAVSKDILRVLRHLHSEEAHGDEGGSISADCTRCPAAVSACGARNCLAVCVSNAADPACVECLCQNHPTELNNAGGNCIIDVYANCAGYAPTPAEVGCGMN